MPRRLGWLVAIGGALATAAWPAAPAAAAPVLYVVDDDAFGPTKPGGVIAVDAASGRQAPVAGGGGFVDPEAVALDRTGRLLVADRGFPGGTDGRLLRVDPRTGRVTTLAAGGLLADPRGVVVEPSGNALVADRCGVDLRPAVVRVDARTGRQSLVSRAGLLTKPRQAALGRGGRLLVADESAFGGRGGVVGVDLRTRRQYTVASRGLFTDPHGVAVERDGRVVVGEQNGLSENTGGVIRVDPRTRRQTVLATGRPFGNPEGLTVGPSGEIFVADGRGVVVAVGPAGGARRLVAEGGDLIDAEGVVVAPGHALPSAGAARVRPARRPAIVRARPLAYYASLPAHCLPHGLDTPANRYRLVRRPRAVRMTPFGPEVRDLPARGASGR